MREFGTALASAGLATVLLTFAFIDLEFAVDLGSWNANAPLADIAALAMLPLGMWSVRTGAGTPMPVAP
ncbi:MAG: hypothetical protein VX000_09085, partial [Myxococcota bacterium]|nr:hypothetical protein [Myxococcota bacterium]